MGLLGQWYTPKTLLHKRAIFPKAMQAPLIPSGILYLLALHLPLNFVHMRDVTYSILLSLCDNQTEDLFCIYLALAYLCSGLYKGYPGSWAHISMISLSI